MGGLIVVYRETIVPTVWLFHLTNLPRRHRHLQVESDWDRGSAGWKTRLWSQAHLIIKRGIKSSWNWELIWELSVKTNNVSQYFEATFGANWAIGIISIFWNFWVLDTYKQILYLWILRENHFLLYVFNLNHINPLYLSITSLLQLCNIQMAHTIMFMPLYKAAHKLPCPQRYGPWRRIGAEKDLRVGADELDVRRLDLRQSFRPPVPGGKRRESSSLIPVSIKYRTYFTSGPQGLQL